MIPTLLVMGLLLGRWWRVAIPAASVGWAFLLLTNGVVDWELAMVGSALLAAANTAVGAGANRLIVPLAGLLTADATRHRGVAQRRAMVLFWVIGMVVGVAAMIGAGLITMQIPAMPAWLGAMFAFAVGGFTVASVVTALEVVFSRRHARFRVRGHD